MDKNRDPFLNVHTVTLLAVLFMIASGALWYKYIDSQRSYFSEDRFNKVKTSWKKEEVLRLLGKPDNEIAYQNGSKYFSWYRPKKDPKKFEFLNRMDFVILIDNRGLVTNKAINPAS